jgi:RNA polymerase sigma factor (sigma-70 family)
MSGPRNPYQAGGALHGNSYIEREADERLVTAIRNNTEVPYLLAARQSGKSSMLARVRTRLDSLELRIVIVDFAALSSDCFRSYDDFVRALLSNVLRELDGGAATASGIGGAEDDAEDEPLFLRAMRVLLSQPHGRIVICLDEIDVLMRYPFKNSVFGAIRAIQNRRATEPALRRVQFVLAGTTAVQKLIDNPGESPFNVANVIWLDDLPPEGVLQLVSLGKDGRLARIVEATRLLLHWTQGSAFLCQEVLARAHDRIAKKDRALPEAITDAISAIIDEAAGSVHFTNIEQVLTSQPHLLMAWRAWTANQLPSSTDSKALFTAGISGWSTPCRNRIYERVYGPRGPLDLFRTELIPPAREAGRQEIEPEVSSSAQLLERAKLGDREALETLMRLYLPRLRRWMDGRIPRGLRGLYDEEDIVQDAAYHAFKNLDQLKTPTEGELAAYLRRSLQNRVFDLHRRAIREPVTGPLSDSIPAETSSPLESAIGGEALSRYEAALARLSDSDRQLIMLRVELCCGYDEIAAMTQASSASHARVLIGRALERLAKEMRHERH